MLRLGVLFAYLDASFLRASLSVPRLLEDRHAKCVTVGRIARTLDRLHRDNPNMYGAVASSGQVVALPRRRSHLHCVRHTHELPPHRWSSARSL